jgi:hypothetical protein
MALYSVAGCKLYIGGVLDDQSDDFVASDFSSVEWTEVSGWSQCGAIGDTSQVITTSLIGEGRDKKMKGTRNAGSMQNVFACDDTDAGQIALIAAEKTNKNYAFKIELNDAASGPPSPVPVPSMRYFIGMVMSASEQGGEANTVRNLDCTIEINSNVVRVAANP